jgi:hypothetical protein
MEQITINEPSIIFRVKKSYDSKMSTTDLYNFTRGRWKINLSKAKKAILAFAILEGQIIEVYKIQDWHDAGTTSPARRISNKKELNALERLKNRFEFVGELAPEEIREKYLNKNIYHLINPLSAAPFFYANI